MVPIDSGHHVHYIYMCFTSYAYILSEKIIIFFDGKKIRYIFSFSGISNKIGDEEYF